jgi:hypothetical protein
LFCERTPNGWKIARHNTNQAAEDQEGIRYIQSVCANQWSLQTCDIQ